MKFLDNGRQRYEEGTRLETYDVALHMNDSSSHVSTPFQNATYTLRCIVIQSDPSTILGVSQTPESFVK